MFKFSNKLNIHLIGIGGIGMSGIAEVLLANNIAVSGSDLGESPRTERLESLGAKVFIGHNEKNIEDASIIVFSSAISTENPEYSKAVKENIPLMRRAEMLAELMKLKKGIAIAGTHGKTTTTSFLSTILEESKFDPTYIIGGIVSNLKGHAKVGKGEFLVAEADESDGSFLLLNPIMSLITNIDNDHIDHYGSFEKLKESFLNFANNIPFYGCCSLNIHDENIRSIRPFIKRPVVTFGISDGTPIADFEARDVEVNGHQTQYKLFFNGEYKIDIKILLPGRHNILNSLGAISLAVQMGVSFEKIKDSISKFVGVGRRFDKLFEKDRLTVIDDYGHHPTEIMTTLNTAKNIYKERRIICVFEPHRYTRTQKCWDEFLRCFNDADELFLGPIYPASEDPIEGITSDILKREINKTNKDFCKYERKIEDIFNSLEKRTSEDLVVIALGAGSIGKKVKLWAEKLN